METGKKVTEPNYDLYREGVQGIGKQAVAELARYPAVFGLVVTFGINCLTWQSLWVGIAHLPMIVLAGALGYFQWPRRKRRRD